MILIPSITYAEPYESLPNPTQINTDIEKFGAKQVLWDRIYNNDKIFGELFAKISSGDAEWIAIAVKLHTVSDGWASEALVMAMSRALVNQPENALSVLSSSFKSGLFLVSDVCSGDMLYISDTESEIEKWRSRAISAVSVVDKENLKEIKARCIEYLSR